MVKNISTNTREVNAQLCVLQEFLSAEDYLEPMLDKLHEFLGNPVMCTDHTHKLIFCRAANPPAAPEWQSVIELGYYDGALMDERFYAIMDRLTSGKEALLIEQDGLDCLLQPAHFSGTFYGVLAVLAQERELGEADARLLELAANIIAVRGQTSLNLERRQEFLYSRIATDLLDGTIRTEKELLLRMKTRNWTQKPYNRLVLLKTDRRQGSFVQYIETNLLKKDLGSKVFTYLGNVLVLEEFEIRPPDILAPDLENFLEQNKLASGVSDVFERLLDLPKYYQQACRVVEYNEESDGSPYVAY